MCFTLNYQFLKIAFFYIKKICTSSQEEHNSSNTTRKGKTKVADKN
jgi:hypothetical protein